MLQVGVCRILEMSAKSPKNVRWIVVTARQLGDVQKGKWGRFQGRWVSFLEGPFWGAMSAMLVVGIGRWLLWWLKAGFSAFHGEKEISRWVVVFELFPKSKKDFEMWESWRRSWWCLEVNSNQTVPKRIEQWPGYLLYTGDYTTQLNIEILISHYTILSEPIRISWNVTS